MHFSSCYRPQVMPWSGPTPPKGTHRYIFLLAQPRTSSVSGNQSVKAHAITAPRERGRWDVNKFLRDHDLTPVASTYFTVSAAAGH